MNSKPKKYVIMFVGHTHTGKTTFAKKLAKNFPDTVRIDNDEIALFAKEKYPSAVLSPYNKIKRGFSNPNLKFLLFKDIYKFCLRAAMNVILSNGNLAKDGRTLVARNAKKHGYVLVTVYFNLPHEIILKRLKETKKDNKVFITSKNWFELFENQKGYAQLPPSKKSGLYFEIKNEKDYLAIMKQLVNLLK